MNKKVRIQPKMNFDHEFRIHKTMPMKYSTSCFCSLCQWKGTCF